MRDHRSRIQWFELLNLLDFIVLDFFGAPYCAPK